MWKIRSVVAVVTVFASMGWSPAAQAQWAVVDVGAIVQLIQQVETLKQQLQTAENQLSQAQQQYQSMTGSRGMQNLLSGTNRNYLPANWSQLAAAVLQPGGTYGALTSGIQSQITANAVLTAAQIALLSPAERNQVQAARQTAAMLQMTSSQAMSATSARFASIQQLINAIGSAQDQKAVLDLQARISAEQAMLQNEHTRLDLLFQAAQAQEWARKQQAREQAISGIGSLRLLPPIGLNH
jgi:type IV secretion system protein VirB5